LWKQQRPFKDKPHDDGDDDIVKGFEKPLRFDKIYSHEFNVLPFLGT